MAFIVFPAKLLMCFGVVSALVFVYSVCVFTAPMQTLTSTSALRKSVGTPASFLASTSTPPRASTPTSAFHCNYSIVTLALCTLRASWILPHFFIFLCNASASPYTFASASPFTLASASPSSIASASIPTTASTLLAPASSFAFTFASTYTSAASFSILQCSCIG